MGTIARGFAFNMAGTLLPAVAAAIAFPVIVAHAGVERLGFLALAWTLVGYLGLLDLGLSRVVVRRVALAAAAGTLADETSVVRRIWTTLLLIAVPCAVCVGVLVPVDWMIGAQSPALLRTEASQAFLYVCAAIPLVVATSVLRGVLDGLQLFAVSNLLKGIFGVLGYAAPALVSLWHADLPSLVGALVLTRFAGFIAQCIVARRVMPAIPVHRHELPWRALLGEGGWLTVTNVVGPLMVNFDRFAIGAIASLGAVAVYTVPQEILLRLLIVPAALSGALYPALARSHGSTESETRARLVRRSLLATLSFSLPLTLVVVAFADPLMTAWMGARFAEDSVPVLVVFSIGFLANSAAQIPYALIQSAGRADVTGRLHLIELPFYGVLLIVSLDRFGIIGAAMTWTLRAMVDCIALIVLSRRLDLLTPAGAMWPRLVIAAAMAGIGCWASLALTGAERWWVEGVVSVVAGIMCLGWLKAAMRDVEQAGPVVD